MHKKRGGGACVFRVVGVFEAAGQSLYHFNMLCVTIMATLISGYEVSLK